VIRLQWLGGSLLGACWAGSPRSRCDCSLWHVEYRDQGSSSRPYTKTNNAMKRVSVNGQGSVAGLVATSDTNPAWVALCHGAHNSESNENGSIPKCQCKLSGKDGVGVGARFIETSIFLSWGPSWASRVDECATVQQCCYLQSHGSLWNSSVVPWCMLN